MRIALLLAIPLLVSGCIDGGLPENPGGGTRPADGVTPPNNLAEVTEGDLHMSGTVEECDAGYCMNVRASNEGSEDYHVSNICVSPYTESMMADGEAVHHREPMFHCEAFGTAPMGPNTHINYNAEWDKQVWTDENGYEPAPPATYTWQITFRAYEEAGGGNAVDLVLQFAVPIE